MKFPDNNDEAETTKTAVSESAEKGKKKHGRDVVLGQIKLEDLVQERLEVRKRVEKNTAAKKTVEKKAVSAVNAAETKPEVKAAEPEIKAAEVVEEAKAEEKPAAEATAKKETEAKPAKTTKTAAKKTTKTTAKKETEAKPAKTTKAAASQKVVLQMNGRADLAMENLIDRVKAAYAAEGHSVASIKNVEVYIKPEESMAYYVIDGYASGISLY